jgi:hypothetical protein
LIELYSRVREKPEMKNINHEGHLASAQKVHKGPALLILFLLRAPFRLAFGLGGKISNCVCQTPPVKPAACFCEPLKAVDV